MNAAVTGYRDLPVSLAHGCRDVFRASHEGFVVPSTKTRPLQRTLAEFDGVLSSGSKQPGALALGGKRAVPSRTGVIDPKNSSDGAAATGDDSVLANAIPENAVAEINPRTASRRRLAVRLVDFWLGYIPL